MGLGETAQGEPTPLRKVPARELDNIIGASLEDALRLLGRPATVLSAFSAGNVGKVASGLHGSVVAADHDAPNDGLGGLGAGEYYARKSGRAWAMPPVVGDWNDLHQAEGLRAVALHLKEAFDGS